MSGGNIARLPVQPTCPEATPTHTRSPQHFLTPFLVLSGYYRVFKQCQFLYSILILNPTSRMNASRTDKKTYDRWCYLLCSRTGKQRRACHRYFKPKTFLFKSTSINECTLHLRHCTIHSLKIFHKSLVSPDFSSEWPQIFTTERSDSPHATSESLQLDFAFRFVCACAKTLRLKEYKRRNLDIQVEGFLYFRTIFITEF